MGCHGNRFTDYFRLPEYAHSFSVLNKSLLFLTSCIFAQFQSQEWSSITSLLTPTGIQSTEKGIVYASTPGGLLEFNPNTEEFTFIKMKDGLVYLDLSCIKIDNQDRLWLGGAYPIGYLQIYEPSLGLVRKITHLDIAHIKMIRIGENTAFAVYEGVASSDIGILEFPLDDDGLPIYKDYYNNFSSEIPILEIRNLDLFQDSIYVTTDQGIFVGNILDNLKSSANWHVVYSGDSAIQYLPGDLPLIIGNSSIINLQGEDYCVSFSGNIIQAARKDDKIGLLTEHHYYEISDCIIDSFQNPVTTQSNTSFDYSEDGNVFIGIKDNGILYWNKGLRTPLAYTPNTSMINAFQAITITKSGNLAATSHFGTLYYNGIDYKNYIPDNYYKNYSGDSETFHALGLDYSPGEHKPISIVEKDNGNLIYCNSGIMPDFGGALIELEYSSGNITKYDNKNGVIDGFWGIYPPKVNSEYMVVNQIEKDVFGNIWVANPFCERYGNLFAVQSSDDNTWSHVNIPDSSSFRPQTIAFDKLNRAWIGFAYDAIEGAVYSSGGIKVLEYSDLDFPDSTTTWLTISNPDDLPGGSADASVWSIVFDKIGHLWILNEKGVRYFDGYNYDRLNKTITLEPHTVLNNGNNIPYDFLSHVSYVKGNRIRVDSQNNKWIVTHQGVWVTADGVNFWPSEEGLHPNNSGLLSDIVYDVAFDNDKGLAYLATDKGISIFQIPFADNPSKEQSMYISPNPFILPDDDRVLIKNIPSGSIIKIMTITGYLIKEIELDINESQATWDGTNEYGEQVGTAVYLVAAQHSSERNKVSKIAVIRK